jgi:hypothetical protein
VEVKIDAPNGESRSFDVHTIRGVKKYQRRAAATTTAYRYQHDFPQVLWTDGILFIGVELIVSASRIERMLAKVEARLVPPPRKYLSAIIDDIDDEATVKKKKEKALAEHVALHPEDVGRAVKDFNWILHEIVRSFIPQR